MSEVPQDSPKSVTSATAHQSKELLALLTMHVEVPALPAVLKDIMTPAYFAKKQNNFYLRLYTDPQVRTTYGTDLPEMESYLQTAEGKLVSEKSTYEAITRGSECINYFMGNDGIPIGDYIYTQVLSIVEKLRKYTLPVDTTIVQAINHDAVLSQLAPYISPYDPAQPIVHQTLSPQEKQTIFLELMAFFTSFFQKLSQEALAHLRYLAFQQCLTRHLEQPGVRDTLENMPPDEAQMYIHDRYFR